VIECDRYDLNSVVAPGTPILVVHVIKGDSFSSVVREGGDIDDTHCAGVAGLCGRDKRGEEQLCEEEVTHVVCAELNLKTFSGLGVGETKDASVVEQDVEFCFLAIVMLGLDLRSYFTSVNMGYMCTQRKSSTPFLTEEKELRSISMNSTFALGTLDLIS
jgi:hypothetical protein